MEEKVGGTAVITNWAGSTAVQQHHHVDKWRTVRSTQERLGKTLWGLKDGLALTTTGRPAVRETEETPTW